MCYTITMASTQRQREIGKKYRAKNREKITNARKLYRQTEKGKAATLRAIRNYEAKHPERKRAWNLARCLELKPCQVCGTMPTHRHHADVSKPLVVNFLCALHHKQAHML